MSVDQEMRGFSVLLEQSLGCRCGLLDEAWEARREMRRRRRFYRRLRRAW